MFHGSHGDAAAVCAAFEELGIQGVTGIGMLLSIVLGMVVVNIGIRKGWTTFVKEAKTQPAWYYGGVLPKDQRESIGMQRTTSFSINHIALQLSWLLLCCLIGQILVSGVAMVLPIDAKLPAVINGVIRAAILWPILCELKLEGLVDTKLIKQLCGFMLEVVVVTAVATLDLELVSTLLTPILILTVVILVLNTLFIFWFTRSFCKDQRFEKAVMVFGMTLGNTAMKIRKWNCTTSSMTACSMTPASMAE